MWARLFVFHDYATTSTHSEAGLAIRITAGAARGRDRTTPAAATPGTQKPIGVVLAIIV